MYKDSGRLKDGRLEPQHLTMTKGWKTTQEFLPRLSCSQTAVQTWEAVRQAAAQGQKARHSLPPSGVWLQGAHGWG